MIIHIKDLNGHELVLQQGPALGLQITLTLNDGSDPTIIELQFDQPTANTLESAIGFFS